MNGVHSIFDDYEVWLDNLIYLINPSGKARCYVFGIFNPEEVDVLVKARRSGEDGPWQAGWNCFSQKSIRSCVEAHGLGCIFHPFTIEIDLPRRADDPLRAWTFLLGSGKRAIVNGTQVLHNYSLLEIYHSD
jgi:hypothetical protein